MVFVLFLAAAVLPMCTALPHPWSTGTVERGYAADCEGGMTNVNFAVIAHSETTVNPTYRISSKIASNQSLGLLWDTARQGLTPDQWSRALHGNPEGWFASLFVRTLGLLVANNTDKFPVRGNFSAPSGSAADSFLQAAFGVTPKAMRLKGDLILKNPDQFSRYVRCGTGYQIAVPALTIAWPGGRDLKLIDMRFYVTNWKDYDQTSTHMRLTPAPPPIPPGPAPPFPPAPAPPFNCSRFGPNSCPIDNSSECKTCGGDSVCDHLGPEINGQYCTFCSCSGSTPSSSSTIGVGVGVTVGVIAAASAGFYFYKKRQGAALGQPGKGLMDTESDGEHKRFCEPESESNPTNVQIV